LAAFLCGALLLAAGTTAAWGPVTQVSIVSTAVHVLSQDRTIRLSNLQSYVREGASISPAEQDRLFPAFAVDPVGVIEQEMYLLRAVRGERVDPYYAYRLGLLGKLVAQATAPFARGNPEYRRRYFEDVDRHIQSVELRPSQRKIVDPRAYFSLVIGQARTQEATIATDYQSGTGFNGVARAAISIDASRSVDAVADVWYTLLSGLSAGVVTAANVSGATRQEYLLNAVDFYLKRGNLTEAQSSYARIRDANMLSVEVRKRVGDMYFDAGQFERAIEEYQAVLDVSPDRRDVRVRMADYYMQAGEQALERGRLEDARDNFDLAYRADMLRTDAQRQRMRVDDLIVARGVRLAEIREHVRLAREAESQAEAEALNRNFARAMTLLNTAQERYGQVTREFPEEAFAADNGLKNVDLLRREYRQQLIRNAQGLSGAGVEINVRHAAERVEGPAEDALKGLLDQEYRAALQSLRQELQAGQPGAPAVRR
jgi:tetratricopeptide (TPR) repeat protein